MLTRFALTALFLILAAAPAAAQSDDPPPEEAIEASPEPRVVYDKRTELDMGELRVDSSIVKPLGAGVAGRRAVTFDPLLGLKLDFNAEMVGSVTQIR